MRVLMIDDEKEWGTSYRSALETAGFEVVFFKGVDKAKEYYETQGGFVHALVLDVMMPGGDWFTPTRTHRGRDTGLLMLEEWKIALIERNQPVFILTNRNDEELVIFVRTHFPDKFVVICHKLNSSDTLFPLQLK